MASVLDPESKSIEKARTEKTYVTYRPFALCGHVTSFSENESYMILPWKND